MTRSETCGRCGQEVRFGVRPSPARPPADQDRPYWMHRDPADDIDHLVVLGTPWTPELQAGIDASLAEMASRGKADSKKQQLSEDEDASPDEWDSIPPPEVPPHDFDPSDLPPRSGMVQIYNLASGLNKDKIQGWEVTALRHYRGPYLGARGQVLSISDVIRMAMRGPEVDNGRRVAVASWRDGAFDFAYTGILRDGVVYTDTANSTALKAWIKETP